MYLKPEAYREFVKTGKFPEGTVLAMELASADTKREPGLQGSYEKEFIGLEVAVKDSSRFEAPGWAYFNFSNGMGSDYKAKAEPFPASAGCVSCHKQNAATDNVFTQFYPVLRAGRSQSGSKFLYLCSARVPRLELPVLIRPSAQQIHFL